MNARCTDRTPDDGAHPGGWYCRLDWREWPSLTPCKEQCQECIEQDEYNRANWPDEYK